LADNLTNTVSAIPYTYTVYGTTSGGGTTATFFVANEVVAANVSFAKTIDKQYATFEDSFTITYSVTNNSGGALDSVVITDQLLSSTTFTQTALTNGTISAGKLTMTTLPADGATQTATVTYTIENTTVPSKSLYTTEASALISAGGSSVTKTATANLEINAAVLTVNKAVTPTGTVWDGNVLTYKITINNTGDVDGIIAATKFVDTWTAGGFTTMTPSDTNIFTADVATNTITNIAQITVPAGDKVEYTFTGSCKIPV
jgi:uncharacterized repeat protein (TIGR01451 family)